MASHICLHTHTPNQETSLETETGIGNELTRKDTTFSYEKSNCENLYQTETFLHKTT